MTFYDFLNEEYTPVVRKNFTPKQLKEIGDFLSQNFGIGVQNSDVQHWKAKDFRLKMAKANNVAICKLVDGNYAILNVVNQQKADVVKTTSNIIINPNAPTVEYLPVKEIIKLSTDVFTLNTADNVASIRTARELAASMHEDPLIAKHHALKSKLKAADMKTDAKAQFKQSAEYIKNLNKKLNLYGIIVTDAYIVEYSGGMRELNFDTKIDSSKFKYVTIFIDSTNLKGLSINYAIHLKSKNITDLKEIESIVAELRSLKSVTTILDSVDYKKLPVIPETLLKDYIRNKIKGEISNY